VSGAPPTVLGEAYEPKQENAQEQQKYGGIDGDRGEAADAERQV